MANYPNIRPRDIRVWGDKEDKEELYRRLERDDSVNIRLVIAEIVDPPLIFTVVFGLINTLKIIYDFLKERKNKNIEVQISYLDGRTITVKSNNPDELQILIKELAQTKQDSKSP